MTIDKVRGQILETAGSKEILAKQTQLKSFSASFAAMQGQEMCQPKSNHSDAWKKEEKGTVRGAPRTRMSQYAGWRCLLLNSCPIFKIAPTSRSCQCRTPTDSYWSVLFPCRSMVILLVGPSWSICKTCVSLSLCGLLLTCDEAKRSHRPAVDSSCIISYYEIKSTTARQSW